MLKKVGILTRHCYPNYGSILQTYALQSALQNVGSHPTVIDYVNEDDTALGLLRANLRISKKAKTKIGFLLYILFQTPTFVSMFFIFRQHQKRLLNLTKRAKDSAELANIAEDLDAVIAGSDQIWNRIIDSIDENYFVKFASDNCLKLSYAASLGSAQPNPEDTELFLASVRAMKTVSVREPTSAKWISEQGVVVRSDVDPVLLHGRNFWEHFISDQAPKKFRYILVYQLHHSHEFSRRLNEIQAKMGLPVVRVSPDWKQVFQPGKTRILVSPESFLGWIRDAACVVTDSFHGTVFSLKFGRPMCIIPPGKNSARLTDVLARVGLERMVISPATEIQSLDEIITYDADVVEKLLEEQAAASWKYLEEILKESRI